MKRNKRSNDSVIIYSLSDRAGGYDDIYRGDDIKFLSLEILLYRYICVADAKQTQCGARADTPEARAQKDASQTTCHPKFCFLLWLIALKLSNTPTIMSKYLSCTVFT